MIRTVFLLARHDWRSLLRRNMAGLVSGVFPILGAPVLGLSCASITQSFVDIGVTGSTSPIEHVVLLGAVSISTFPVMYGVFLACDSIVVEVELGTIELVWWSPISEWTFVVGKFVLPAAFGILIGIVNLLVFGSFYSLGISTLNLVDASPWLDLLWLLIPLTLTVCLAVLIGLFISAWAPSTKAAATLSLSAGLLLTIIMALGGATLFATGLTKTEVLVVICLGTLLGCLVVGSAVANRLGTREKYFLRN